MDAAAGAAVAPHSEGLAREALAVALQPRRARLRVCIDIGDDVVVPLPAGVNGRITAAGTKAVRRQHDKWYVPLQPLAPFEFEVPAGVAMLRAEAHGYVPVELCLPLPDSQGVADAASRDPVGSGGGPEGTIDVDPVVVDLGTVTLHAAAQLRLRLLHVPPEFRGRWKATLGTVWRTRAATAALRWRGDCGEALLPAPTSEQLYLGLDTEDTPGLCLRLPDEVFQRAASSYSDKEVREITVDFAAIGEFTLRLAGVDRALLPYVQIAVADIWRPGFACLDGHGEVRVAGVPSRLLQFTVRPIGLHDAAVPLRSSDGDLDVRVHPGQLLVLQPEQPLVGIGFRGADGGLQPFALGLDRPPKYAFPCPVQVVGADSLAATHVVFAQAAAGCVSVPVTALAGTGALRFLESGAASAASLCLRPTPPLTRRSGLELRLEALDATLPPMELEQRDGLYRAAAVAAGRYRLLARVPGSGSGTVELESCLSFAAGQSLELPLCMPDRSPWTGEIANWSLLSEDQRPNRIHIGGASALLEEDGSFRLTPLQVLRSDVTVAFTYGASIVSRRATATTVDPWRRRVTALAPEKVGIRTIHAVALSEQTPWVRVNGMSGGEVIHLCGDGWLGLPSDRELSGHLGEYLREGCQTTGWFVLPPGEDPVTIPTGIDARWITVRVQRPVRHFAVRVLGPPGCPPATVAERAQRGAVPVLLVHGTRGIEVETDGELHTFAAEAADAVVL